VWWLLAAAGLAIAICVVGLVAASTLGRAIAAIALVVIVVAVGRLVTLKAPEIVGATLHQHGFLRDRRVPLAGARTLTLNPNPGGFGQLQVQPRHGHSAYLVLMVRSPPFISTSLDPDTLDRLGAALLATGHVRAADLQTLLQLQAEHLRAGGPLDRSPLRGLDRADAERYRGLDTLTALLRRASPPG
jgi:hypothetical protein